MISPHTIVYSPLPPPSSTFVVFDRDNTLTIDKGYTHRIEDFQWNPQILPVFSLLSRRHIPVAIATNQSGVARGMFSIDQVNDFHTHLVASAADLGLQVVAIATCPHPALEPPTCQCRKPLPGLLTELVKVMKVSPENGFMIGDQNSDLEAGRRAGLSSHLVADAQSVLTSALEGQ